MVKFMKNELRNEYDLKCILFKLAKIKYNKLLNIKIELIRLKSLIYG
jgi:hypothetical protein